MIAAPLGWWRLPCGTDTHCLPCGRWYSCRDLLPNSWLALTSSCQLLQPHQANPQDPATLMQHRWQPWFIIITYLVCFSFNSSTEQDRFSPMRYPAQATGQRNKFWGLAFTCRELLQPCNTIPFYWTSGPENQNSTPRFKMIATTDTITHLSFQDWVN